MREVHVDMSIVLRGVVLAVCYRIGGGGVVMACYKLGEGVD